MVERTMAHFHFVKVYLLVVILTSLMGCSSHRGDIVLMPSDRGTLDLRAWDFANSGSVSALTWRWDEGVFWGPRMVDRPSFLPTNAASESPDHGTFWKQGLVTGTLSLSVFVESGRQYGLQIGAFPGALRVWCNGTEIFVSGRLSSDATIYRAGGAGRFVTLQPLENRLDLVVQVATTDPFVRAFEPDRRWILADPEYLVPIQKTEESARLIQLTLVAVFGIVFLALMFRFPDPAMSWFLIFVVLCFIKLLFNVEQMDPLGGPSFALGVTHVTNLLPFGALAMAYRRAFPDDVSRRMTMSLVGATLVMAVWEILPFALLLFGHYSGFDLVRSWSWSAIMNAFVVGTTVLLFERTFAVYRLRRPRSAGLFWGGILLGVLILIPIPLNLFSPVPFTYFLGWAMPAYLGIVMTDFLIHWFRAQTASREQLEAQVQTVQTLLRFAPRSFAQWLRKSSVDRLVPGDEREARMVFVEVWTSVLDASSLAALGSSAATRNGDLVQWADNRSLWVFQGGAERALGFAVDASRAARRGDKAVVVVVTSATVVFRILDAGNRWIPYIQGIPRDSLDRLYRTARQSGAGILLDSGVQDGLVVGGWRRHRPLVADGSLLELYEADPEAEAAAKDEGNADFVLALGWIRTSRWTEAEELLVRNMKLFPLDRGLVWVLDQLKALRPTP